MKRQVYLIPLLLKVILIAAVILSINYFICNDPKVIITEYDTIYKNIPVYTPIPIGHLNTDQNIRPEYKLIIKTDTTELIDTIQRIDTIYMTDTTGIVEDYFRKYVYKDTILNDSTGFIAVKDTVFMNSILSRSADIEIYH